MARIQVLNDTHSVTPTDADIEDLEDLWSKH